jgi:hypothetical protein
MRIEHSAPVTDSQGRTRINFSIVIESGYAPGEAAAMEFGLKQQFNTVGALAMGVFLKRFDTHGEPIRHAERAHTSKGLSPETYQTSFGPVEVARHTYQSSSGGQTFCPLEDRARTLLNATPHFAQMLSSGYCDNSGRAYLKHLKHDLDREVSLEYLQNVSGAAGKSALAQEQALPYALEADPEQVAAVVVLGDSTCAHIVGEGYKHVATGAFVLLDKEGETLETIHLANAPEEGKVMFWQRMGLEFDRLKHLLVDELGRDILWFGLCDGAEDMQNWLAGKCDLVGLDFWHASEYVAATKGAFGADDKAQKTWLEKALHDLKHNEGGAAELLRKLNAKLKSGAGGSAEKTALEKASAYISRNLERMEYSLVAEHKLPIGSGVIEGACKHVVKRRSGVSGARWKRPGLQSVLALRSLWLSSNRWEQYWKRVARQGY